MTGNETYKKQQKVAFVQFLVDLPSFVAVLVSALFSGSLIVWMDVLDYLGYVLRSAMVMQLSKKLFRDLRYEYNYGIGKVEAMAALFCDGIIFGGLLLMSGFCCYELLNPGKPSDILLAVIGLKGIDIIIDVVFIRAQREVIKENGGAIAKSLYASHLDAILFDSAMLISLVIAWALRNNPVSWYFSPVVGLLFAGYLMRNCLKRFKSALDELTDKTLPEEIQMKILKVMTQFYDDYAQLHFVKSHKSGETVAIDLLLSFGADTSYTQIRKLNHRLQTELSKEIDKCTVNIIVP